MTPVVSVLLPVLNGERTLARVLESVLQQSFADFELLVIDAGSQDGSAEIVRTFARADKRVLWWRSSTAQWPFESYNECLARCNGRFVKFITQDDLLSPQLVERVVEVFERNASVDLVATQRAFIDKNGHDRSWLFESVHTRRHVTPARPVAGAEVLVKSLLPIRNIVGELCMISARRTACGDGFDPAFKCLGELELWLRVLQNGQFYLIAEELCSSIVHKRSLFRVQDCMDFACDLLRLGVKLQPILRWTGLSKGLYREGAFESIEEAWRERADAGAGAFFSAPVRKLDWPFGETDCSAGRTLDSVTSEDIRMLEQLASKVDSTPSQSELSLKRQLWFSVFRYEDLVEQREQKLRLLLTSPAWRFTKSLRELKAKYSATAVSPTLTVEPTVQAVSPDKDCASWQDCPDPGLPDGLPVRSEAVPVNEGEPAVPATVGASEAAQEILEQHKAYLRELRKQIVAVRGSSSMRLIAFLQRRKT